MFRLLRCEKKDHGIEFLLDCSWRNLIFPFLLLIKLEKKFKTSVKLNIANYSNIG